MRRILLVSGIVAFAGAAYGDVLGTFVGPGTYATKEGCAKLKALAGGADRNVATVPETLTQNGFAGWEGGCTFRSITEKEKGRLWSASMDCHEGAMEGPESDLFERMPDGKLKVTIMGNAIIFERCETE